MLNNKHGRTLLWVIIIILVVLGIIFFLTRPTAPNEWLGEEEAGEIAPDETLMEKTENGLEGGETVEEEKAEEEMKQ